MSQKRFRRVLVQMLAIVTALMMVLCMSAFAEDGDPTEDDIAAVDETAGEPEDTDAIDEGELDDADLGDEEGFDEVLEDDEVAPEDDDFFEEEGDLDDETGLVDEDGAEDEAALDDVGEEEEEEEELEAQTAEELEETTVVTVVKRVPSTGDFNASVLPLMAGFAAVGAAVVALRRRATK